MRFVHCNHQLFNYLRAINYQFTRGKCKKPVPEVGKTTYVYKNVPEYPHPTEEFEKDEFLPRRLSYWPPDIPQLRLKSKIKPWAKIKEYITVYPPEEKPLPEYTDEPQYPPITDFRIYNSALEEKQNRRLWYEKIKALPTYDQKMYEIINIKQHPTVALKAWSHVYNNLPMFQHITRTRLIKNNLPNCYDGVNVDRYRNDVRDAILDAVRLHFVDANKKRYGREYRARRPSQHFSRTGGDVKVENLVEDISNVCVKILSADSPHLLEAQVSDREVLACFLMHCFP